MRTSHASKHSNWGYLAIYEVVKLTNKSVNYCGGIYIYKKIYINKLNRIKENKHTFIQKRTLFQEDKAENGKA